MGKKKVNIKAEKPSEIEQLQRLAVARQAIGANWHKSRHFVARAA
jgi:hypothetical protein